MDAVYISGPRENVEDFAKRELSLKQFDYNPINPIVFNEHMIKSKRMNLSTETLMKADLIALLECKGISFLEGSENSDISNLERKIAEVCGIPT
ncbi:MAG: DUF4406 domain-containing protein [Bacilli bacterium]|nr:DUF4406 domain-containing protein [Bacilli bacterium]